MKSKQGQNIIIQTTAISNPVKSKKPDPRKVPTKNSKPLVHNASHQENYIMGPGQRQVVVNQQCQAVQDPQVQAFSQSQMSLILNSQNANYSQQSPQKQTHQFVMQQQQQPSFQFTQNVVPQQNMSRQHKHLGISGSGYNTNTSQQAQYYDQTQQRGNSQTHSKDFVLLGSAKAFESSGAMVIAQQNQTQNVQPRLSQQNTPGYAKKGKAEGMQPVLDGQYAMHQSMSPLKKYHHSSSHNPRLHQTTSPQERFSKTQYHQSVWSAQAQLPANKPPPAQYPLMNGKVVNVQDQQMVNNSYTQLQHAQQPIIVNQQPGHMRHNQQQIMHVYQDPNNGVDQPEYVQMQIIDPNKIMGHQNAGSVNLPEIQAIQSAPISVRPTSKGGNKAQQPVRNSQGSRNKKTRRKLGSQTNMSNGSNAQLYQAPAQQQNQQHMNANFAATGVLLSGSVSGNPNTQYIMQGGSSNPTTQSLTNSMGQVNNNVTNGQKLVYQQQNLQSTVIKRAGQSISFNQNQPNRSIVGQTPQAVPQSTKPRSSKLGQIESQPPPLVNSTSSGMVMISNQQIPSQELKQLHSQTPSQHDVLQIGRIKTEPITGQFGQFQSDPTNEKPIQVIMHHTGEVLNANQLTTQYLQETQTGQQLVYVPHAHHGSRRVVSSTMQKHQEPNDQLKQANALANHEIVTTETQPLSKDNGTEESQAKARPTSSSRLKNVMRFRDVPTQDLRLSKQSRSSYEGDRGDRVRPTEGVEQNDDSVIEFQEDPEDMNDRHSDELNVYETQLQRQTSQNEEDGVNLQVEQVSPEEHEILSNGDHGGEISKAQKIQLGQALTQQQSAASTVSAGIQINRRSSSQTPRNDVKRKQQYQSHDASSDISSEDNFGQAATQRQYQLQPPVARDDNTWSDSEDCNCSAGGSSFGTYLGTTNTAGGCPHYPAQQKPEEQEFDHISERTSDAESDSDEDPLKGIPGADKIKKSKKKRDTAPKEKSKKTKEPQKTGKGQAAAGSKGSNVQAKNTKADKGASKKDSGQTKAGKQEDGDGKDKSKAAGKGGGKKEAADKEGGKTAAVDGAKEESPQKKPKKGPVNQKALIYMLPKNIEEQEALFFENDCKIAPTFEYENYATTQKLMASFRDPSDEYMPIATQILESFLATYGSESAYLESEGDILTQEETEETIIEYLTKMDIVDRIEIAFTRKQVAATSVTHDPKSGKSRINVRTPCEYRRGRILGVLDHEIGTHYLRKHNERAQVWNKKREKYEIKPCIKTEEGFACTNQLVRTALDENKRPYLYRSAINYYTAFKASTCGFVELFDDLGRYIDDKMSRWKFVLRVKRGVQDTSEPGGLYKDQVYLEGAIEILRARKTLDFAGLCCGKISLDDLKRPAIYNKLKKEKNLIAPIMEDMEQYMLALDIIAETNHIDLNTTENNEQGPTMQEISPSEERKEEQANV